jgi:hypothetical protein
MEETGNQFLQSDAITLSCPLGSFSSFTPQGVRLHAQVCLPLLG